MQAPCKVNFINSVRATASSAGPEAPVREVRVYGTGGESKWKPNHKDGCEQEPLAFSREGQKYSDPLDCPEEEVSVSQ